MINYTKKFDKSYQIFLSLIRGKLVKSKHPQEKVEVATCFVFHSAGVTEIFHHVNYRSACLLLFIFRALSSSSYWNVKATGGSQILTSVCGNSESNWRNRWKKLGLWLRRHRRSAYFWRLTTRLKILLLMRSILFSRRIYNLCNL